MTERLTINRQFYAATKRSGTKQMESGAKPLTPTGHVPRISRLLALAHHCFRLVQSGAIINQSELAHFSQISTTRMTQIMWLDNLAPDIQEEILFLPKTVKGRDPIKESDLRPIAKALDWKHHRKMWQKLKSTEASTSIVQQTAGLHIDSPAIEPSVTGPVVGFAQSGARASGSSVQPAFFMAC